MGTVQSRISGRRRRSSMLTGECSDEIIATAAAKAIAAMKENTPLEDTVPVASADQIKILPKSGRRRTTMRRRSSMLSEGCSEEAIAAAAAKAVSSKRVSTQIKDTMRREVGEVNTL